MRKVMVVFSVVQILLATLLLPQSAKARQLNLTEAEQLFIEENPIIKLGVDPQFVPFEFIDDDGEYKGIATDYLQLISKLTGLQFEIQKGLTWPEAYDLAINGELDGLPAVGKTPEREANFLLSEPYYFFKRVIVTTDQAVQISSLEDLAGLTVAVQRNSSHHSYLLEHEKINLSLYDSVEAALAAVSTGEEVAFIGNLATTNYLIRSTGFSNLRFISFEADKQQALHFATRQDWPELISIFNKAVSNITEQEKQAINEKWIALDTKLDYGPIIRITIIISAIFIIILLVSLFWNLRLRKEIAKRKLIEASLVKANELAEITNEKLQYANRELEKISMIDGLTGVFNRRYFDIFLDKLWSIDMQKRFPIAIIMIDIDYFKKYNDTYGHLAGDQCLKSVAAIIDRLVGGGSDFVARYGGEEFVVLLSNSTEEEATKLAEQIREKIEQSVIDNGIASTFVTVSLGVAAMVSTKNEGPDQLIVAADEALYKAKHSGRNCVRSAKYSHQDYQTNELA